MSSEHENEDVFQEQQERVESPMGRLARQYVSQNPISVVAGIVFSVLARTLNLIPPLVLALAIDSIFGSQSFSIPLISDGALPEQETGQLVLSATLIALAFLFGAAAHWARNWGWNALAQRVQHTIRTDTYDAMQRLNMGFFSDKQTGEMMSVLSNDVNRLERFLNEGLNAMFRLGVMVLGIAAVLLYINWQLALIALLPIPILVAFTYVFIQTIQPKYEQARSTVGELNSRLENNLGGIHVIKTSTTEPYESERVEDSSQNYFDAQWDAIKTRIKFFPGLRVAGGLGFVITFTVGGFWVLNGAPAGLSGELRVGEFVLFILYTQRFIWPVAQFGDIINKYQRARASTARIFGLMDESERIEEGKDSVPLTDVKGDVAYESVSFGYDDEVVMSNVSFEADRGETVALVGPTGAGKSTVMKLLLRMYDVDEGRITIEGKDIREYTIKSLREHVGYVGQDTFLFHGTVRENIKYGAFDADEEDVLEAAKSAEAHEFITNLPDGYDTEVGERGVKLSGGQRQRISIARAILQDPNILILDEATSDVDTETEMLIQRSLDELTENRTTFAIAHRLSTIKDADKIVVLEDGEVAERGTHSSLIDEDGLYANLWSVQAGEVDDLPEEFIRRAAKRRAQTESSD